MPRSEAETAPQYKQIIPYVIMAHGDKYFSYSRGAEGGEKRLVGNRSIGIGGHIDSTDNDDPYTAYQLGIQREVDEEVFVETDYTEKTIAIINDDSNSVGQVHLGVVLLWELKNPSVRARENQISDPRFETLEELYEGYDELETWSQLCLKGLGS